MGDVDEECEKETYEMYDAQGCIENVSYRLAFRMRDVYGCYMMSRGKIFPQPVEKDHLPDSIRYCPPIEA